MDLAWLGCVTTSHKNYVVSLQTTEFLCSLANILQSCCVVSILDFATLEKATLDFANIHRGYVGVGGASYSIKQTLKLSHRNSQYRLYSPTECCIYVTP